MVRGLRELAQADASCGGKAHGLARLIAAGVRVPAGFVVEAVVARDVAFGGDGADGAGEAEADRVGRVGHVVDAIAERVATAAIPAAVADAVMVRAAALGVVAVRSSARFEDTASGAAAGVLESVVDVRCADVWPAIRSVWASALAPLAGAYARHRGPESKLETAGAVAVIVQRFVRGPRVTVYTRAPGSATSEVIWIQRGSDVREVRRQQRRDDGGPATEAEVGSADDVEVIRAALAAERAIGADGGADVEIVVGDDGVWVVQARPIVRGPAATRRRTGPPPVVIAALAADGREWTWDVAHNPDPLSPAQIGLVERVERAGCAPWSMRVCAGYLYTTLREAAAPEVARARMTVAALRARAAAIEAAFASDLPDEVLPVDEAIERYLAFYRRWSVDLVPLIASARRGLTADGLAGARPSAVEATLLAAARGELDEADALARLGVLSPAWDVAVPTFAEQPQLVTAAIARARAALPSGPSRRRGDRGAPLDGDADDADAVERDAEGDHADDDAVALARFAADLAERDDIWFARAQWLVRRAVLAHAHTLGIAAQDACWLPLDELITATAVAGDGAATTTATTIEPVAARRRAAAARQAAARAGEWDMPLVIGGRDGAARAGSELTDTAQLPLVPERGYRGIGTGASVTGRVVRFGSLAAAVAVGPRDVIVARAVTPALAVFVVGCAALVSETGGPLDHGAALARELGIPCVVGCAGAWSELRDGETVTVDGAAGRVVRVRPA